MGSFRLPSLVSFAILLCPLASFAQHVPEAPIPTAEQHENAPESGRESVTDDSDQQTSEAGEKDGSASGEDGEEQEEEIDPLEQPLQFYYNDFVRKCLHDDLFWRKVKVAGYVAQSYTWNFNRPYDRTNSYRAYDRKHNRYMFHVLQLSAYGESTPESRLGFGLKVNAGRDTQVFVPYEEPTTDHVDIYEAWVSYLLTDELLLKAGKMPTLAGFEVADEKDNYNISRGILWSLLQPVTHTGVRLTYTDPEKFYDLSFGVHRGWDTFRRDNNDALSYEARLGINQTEKLSYALTLLTGPESEGNSRDFRHLIDVVATYKATEKLTYGVNYDLRWDEGAAPSGGTAASQGLAGYLKYDVTEKCSVAARVEAVRDEDGAVSGVRQTLGDVTLTSQYKFRENLWGRLEYRHDQSTDSVFTRGHGTSHGQNTIAASLLFTF